MNILKKDDLTNFASEQPNRITPTVRLGLIHFRKHLLRGLIYEDGFYTGGL